jgi:hypothetical protein
MISFFCKIPQKLLQENSFTRYLAYAKGNIFLFEIWMSSPFWGSISVEQINNKTPSVPLGTGENL